MTLQSPEKVHVYVPELGSQLYFDPATNFLGKSTVGEVFLAKAEQKADDRSEPQCYALKIFLDRGERPHFRRECEVLEGLRHRPHANIVLFLHYWTSDSIQYILFPLAMGDLYTHFRTTSQPQTTARFVRWYTQQPRGLCDALSYIHNYAIPMLDSDKDTQMQRIGFYHDIKPLSDFGSGLVSEFKDGDTDSIYNIKPSTGDPIYTSPEYALDGRVSRPKDIWSLGCIYMESLIWILDPCRTALDNFQNERKNMPESHMLPDGHTYRKPMYWFQDLDGEVHLHPAVTSKMDALRSFCKGIKSLGETQRLVELMLTLPHRGRPLALELRNGFDEILASY